MSWYLSCCFSCLAPFTWDLEQGQLWHLLSESVFELLCKVYGRNENSTGHQGGIVNPKDFCFAKGLE